MNMVIRLLFGTFSFAIISFGNIFAQTDPDLFQLPDTVCNDHEIIPSKIIEGAESYLWTFCPPNLASEPEGVRTEPFPSIDNPAGFVIAEDNNMPFSFHINADGSVIRMRYENGLEGPVSFVTTLGRASNKGGGIYVVKGDDQWYAFAVGGSTLGNSQLVRFEFGNGLIRTTTNIENLGNLNDSLDVPNQLYIAKHGGQWYGFTFNQSSELLRLNFGSTLMNIPSVTNLGNINDEFSLISGIDGVRDQGSWHLLVTDRALNRLKRVSFGNSLNNIPSVDDLGNFDGRLNTPIGVTIASDCYNYYAYVLCRGNNSFITLQWEGPISDDPTAFNYGNVGDINQARVMSGITRENSAFYIFSVNGIDNSISRLQFKPCDYSSPSSSQERIPPPFKFREPGLQTVSLTINSGLPGERTECQQIFIYDHPPLTTSNDTMICQGDTIQLEALSAGVDSFKWSPNYFIDELGGQFVRVHPPVSQVYSVTAHYAKNCIVRTDINVEVSKIVSDAGPDRLFGDGSTTVLGGAGTTIGPQYQYRWDPNIGVTGPLYEPFTSARPPYDITYYLWVTNDYGCEVVDSVNISVPCDELNMPNAFSPDSNDPSVKFFGPKNQQLGKINYFKIFDRWGREIFSTSAPDGVWDGNIDGNPAPLGVYVWELDAFCDKILDRRFRRSGTITLLR